MHEWQRSGRRAEESPRRKKLPRSRNRRGAPAASLRDSGRLDPSRSDAAGTEGDVSDPANPAEVLRQLALTARMNRIYYEMTLRCLERADFWLRLTSAVLASAGVALALKLCQGTGPALVAGVVAGVLGATSLVWGLPERIKNAAAILPEWVELMHRADRMRAKGQVTFELIEPLQVMEERIEKLEAEKIRHPHKCRQEKAWTQACKEDPYPRKPE
jgi:hypothetical protein